ncbi:MAG: Benzylsuccinate synthase activating enzyme [Promethearchaeota archaeon]|nr:MAG: Benzylsuccinate synthase activating enzyme [Candidatus Lokiarchaeota archaeon]
MKGFITNIKRNSLDDGPGIRTVLFFKGCPLRCVWCQNPETQSPNQEISYECEKCVHCHKCQEHCPENAIDFSETYPINKKLCTYCGGCIDVCKMEALKFVGKYYTISQLIKAIMKDKVFYDNSGGGITLSGGEPTMQTEFLHQFLKELKSKDIHVCLETCGYFNTDTFFKLLFPHIDLIYFDLKIFDPTLHKRYCGVSNEVIFKNFEKMATQENIELLPRIPLVPNITSFKKNLELWATYLKKFNIKKIGLLPYNPLWLSKIPSLGKSTNYTNSDWLSNEQKSEIKVQFSEFEYKNF